MNRIKTKNYLLKPLSLTDKEFFYSLYSDREIMRWIDSPWNKKKLERIWSRAISCTERGSNWLWVIKCSEVNVGLISLKKELGDEVYHMGTILIPSAQRKGGASEVMTGLMEYSKKEFNARFINVQFKTDHIASLRLVKSLGFIKYEENISWQYWSKNLV